MRVTKLLRSSSLAQVGALLVALSVSGCVRLSAEVEANDPPLAVAPEDKVVLSGETVVLDGSASSDPNGDTITFRWRQVEGSGEPVTLLDAESPVASFTAPDSTQRLFFQLIVDDGADQSAPAVTRVDVIRPENLAPEAVVPEVVTAFTGETVVLDGNGSTDPDGDALTFQWTQVEGSGDPVTLEDADSAVASFTAPDTAQRLFFRLVVSDGISESPPGIVRVEIAEAPNTPPVAVVTDSLAADVGETVVLDGSGSYDDDGDALTYTWSQVEGSGDPINLQNADSAVASFTAPDVGQRLFFRLTVNDGQTESNPVVVRVSVNAAPVALVPGPQSTPNQTPIVIDGAGADPDGDIIRSYAWTVTSAPPAGTSCVANPSPCVSGADSPTLTFTPPVQGTFVLELVVSDGVVNSPAASVQVSSVSRKPIPVPTADQTVVTNNTTINLDGSGSYDPDTGETIAGYKWTISSTPTGGVASLTPTTGDVVNPSLTLQGKGAYFVQLVVTDSAGTVSDPVSLRIDTTNNAPTAFAGNDTSVTNGATIQLAGVGSDPDGDTLTYAWSLVDSPPGGALSLTGADQSTVSFTPTVKSLQSDPVLCGTGECYKLALTVSDGITLSTPDTVVVTALNRIPLANAGPNQAGNDTFFTLDGTASSDLDGDTLVSYTWTQRQGDPDVTGGVGFLTGATVTVAAPQATVYEFYLTVNDGENDSVIDSVIVDVGTTNQPPIWATSPAAESIAETGTAFPLDASGATDPEGRPLTITWTKTGGPSLFPTTFTGTTPTVNAPSFKALLAGGQTWATYDVVANDGTHNSSAQSVVLYAIPSATEYVVVAPGGDDAAIPDCGGGLNPCGTLIRARTLVDAGGGLGDGRSVILTANQFTHPNASPFSWLGGVSLIGGLDATTFTASSRTDYSWVSNGCYGTYEMFTLGSTVGDDVVFRDIRFSIGGISGCTSNARAFVCGNCRARFQDVEIAHVSTRTNTRAMDIRGTASAPVFERVVIDGGGGANSNVGIITGNGGSFTLIDSTVSIVTTDTAISNHAINADGGDVTIDGSFLEVWGAPPTTPTDISTLRVANGSLTLTNSVLTSYAGGDCNGVYLPDTPANLVNNTLIGSGLSGTGAGVTTTTAPINLMNNLVVDHDTGLVLGVGSTGPAVSEVHNNAWDPLGTTIGTCETASGPVDLANPADLNDPAGSGCNQGANDWKGNTTGNCPLVDVSAEDFRLNDQVANDCLDTGAAATPAGLAPLVDRDGNVRPDATSGLVDIGAHEAP